MATKNKTAQRVEWKVPGIMSGNAVPGWEDQQGSIVRRIVLWLFNTAVVEQDTQLSSKLEREMPAVLLKANKGYLWAVQHVGGRGIWASGVLPPYFHTTREEMAEMVNSMRGFLGSDMVVFDPTFYCPLSEVRSAWNRWVQDRNISPKPRWTSDLYTGPLQQKGLTLAKDSLAYPRSGTSSRTKRQYVRGMDLSANVQEDDENADPNAEY